MMLVCISHAVFYLPSSSLLHWVLVLVTRVATPTFLLLSGFVIAHLLRSGATRPVSLMLIDRGLFLLIVAHALLGLWMLPDLGVLHWAFARTNITDAVGVALLIAVPLQRLSGRMRIGLGLLLCLSGWFVARTVNPEAEWSRLLASILFNVGDPQLPTIASLPLVPYLGVFLIGMGLHSSLRDELAAGNVPALTRRLLWVGGVAVALVVALVALWPLIHSVLAHLFGESGARLVHQTINLRFKRPPSPAYLAFYGGVGLLMLAILFRARPAWLIGPIVRHASIIGRASLMCYVAQDWLFFLLPKLLGLNRITSSGFWLAWLVGCVMVLYALALAWGRVRGNRFLTVGLKRLGRALESVHAAHARNVLRRVPARRASP